MGADLSQLRLPMTSRLDIAVCGCGPAGLAAALLLRRAGHRVRIIERFEVPRPVGSGLILQPTGLAVLRELDLLDCIVASGAPIERLFGRVVPSGRLALDVRYGVLGAGARGVAVHRATLFSSLHDAAQAAGIEVVAGVPIDGIDRNGMKPTLVAAGGRKLGPFDLVVDALGKNSPLAAGLAKRTALAYGALWVNLPWPRSGTFRADALEQRYRGAHQMAGVLPIGQRRESAHPEAAFFWSLRCSAVEGWRNAPLAEWKSDVAALWPEAALLLESVTRHEQVTFAQYDHFTAAVPFSDRVVHIGDAARATSPQLGQGANMALLDALALARSLEETEVLADALAHYARMRRWHVRVFQWASAMFTPFYQSDSRVLPLLRDWIAAPLARLPIGDAIVARLVSGMTVSPLRGSGFLPWGAGVGVAPVFDSSSKSPSPSLSRD